MHSFGPHSAGCGVRVGGEFPSRVDLVRGGRPEQPVPPSARSACNHQVHVECFSTIFEDEASRAEWSHDRGGDYKKSLECSSAVSKLADALVIDAERRQLDKVVAMAQAQMKAPITSTKTKRSDDETSFQAAKDSKKIVLDPSEPSKFGIIGVGLSRK